MAKKALKQPAFQLRVTLLDVEPPIWRRIVLPGHWHFGLVHAALQSAMGWENAHLHEFEIGERRLGERPDEGMSDERQVRLHEVLTQPGDGLLYLYDFGDSWEHEVVVEEVLPATATARCLGGARRCPLEDSGGAWEYAASLEALADPSSEDHEHTVEWFGEKYDAEAFDVAVADRALQRLG